MPVIVTATEPIECTPNALLAAYPCLECLSMTELLAVIALVTCKLNARDANADCSANTLMEQAKCFTCMSDHQLLEAIAALIINLAIANGYIASGTDLRPSMGCLVCLDTKKLKAIVTKQFCEYITDVLTA